MELLIKIKEVILKIWSWILSLFKRNKKHFIKKEKKLAKVQTKKIYKASIHRDETIEANIIEIYPGVLPKEIENLNRKIDIIKKRIIANNDKNIDEEINNLQIINEIINNDKIFVNQIDELNNIIDLTLYDKELHLNTNEKINILKDGITNLIDDNLKDYEKHIIEKAYYEYDKVNYIVVTTILIDELQKELQNINQDFISNRHNKHYYFDKIRKIEERLERISKINNKEEVQRELEQLKSDFYTKRKDKYDLLYNNEIFTNLKNKCNQILENVEVKEQEKKKIKVELRKEKLKKEQQEKEQKKKELQEKKEELLAEKQREDNILKRFMDLELARQILMKRELEKLKKEKKDIVKDTLESYDEFLIGENNTFNFSRNKLKTEVAKLYNDTLRNICALEDAPYMPIEHINIKLSSLVSETIENQQRLNALINKEKKVNIEENEKSIRVSNKLNGILEKEKTREDTKDKVKVYTREYRPPKSNEDSNKKNTNK